MSTTDTRKQPPPLAFVDTETTGLDPFLHDPWEIAIILRKPGESDQEFEFHLEPDLTNADPKALEINRFFERVEEPGWRWHNRAAVAGNLVGLLDGAVMIGSNPAFDAEMLTKPIARIFFHEARPWHYRTIDVATLAAGYRFGQAASGTYGGDFAFPADLPSQPYKSYNLSRAVGVEPPAKDVAHTALGDARWARDVYDAVTCARPMPLDGAA